MISGVRRATNLKLFSIFQKMDGDDGGGGDCGCGGGGGGDGDGDDHDDNDDDHDHHHHHHHYYLPFIWICIKNTYIPIVKNML